MQHDTIYYYVKDFLNLHLTSSKTMIKKALFIFVATSLTGCDDNRSQAERIEKQNRVHEFQSVDSMFSWNNINGDLIFKDSPIRFPGEVVGWLPYGMGLTIYLKSQSDKEVELDMKLTEKVKNTLFIKGEKYFFECRGGFEKTQDGIRVWECKL